MQNRDGKITMKPHHPLPNAICLSVLHVSKSWFILVFSDSSGRASTTDLEKLCYNPTRTVPWSQRHNVTSFITFSFKNKAGVHSQGLACNKKNVSINRKQPWINVQQRYIGKNTISWFTEISQEVTVCYIVPSKTGSLLLSFRCVYLLILALSG